jgi:hypothetical protein
VMTGRVVRWGVTIGVPVAPRCTPSVTAASGTYLARPVARGLDVLSPVPSRPGRILRWIGGVEGGVGTDSSCTLGAVWHPVVLASPDHAALRGQHPCPLPAEVARPAPGSRVVALRGDRRDATPSPPTEPVLPLVSAIPETCPPGEGTMEMWSMILRAGTRVAFRRSGTARPCGVAGSPR